MLKSVRLKFSFLYVILLDLGYYALTLLGVYTLAAQLLMPKFSELMSTITMLDRVPESFPDSVLPNVQSQGFTLMAFFVGYVLLQVLLFSFFKGLILHILAEKKSIREFMKTKLWRLCLLNLILLVVTILFWVMFFPVYYLSPNFYVVIILFGVVPLMMHYSLISNAVLVMRKKWLKASFVSFSRINKFLLPYLMILIVGAIMLYFLNLIYNLSTLQIFDILRLVLLVVYFNWAKNYVLIVLKPLV